MMPNLDFASSKSMKRVYIKYFDFDGKVIFISFANDTIFLFTGSDLEDTKGKSESGLTRDVVA